MTRFILFDPEKCIGCRTCSLACSFHHEGEFNPALARITTLWMTDIGRFVTVTCQQCEEPLCAEACPRNAIQRDSETGAVVVDEALCIGCRSCFIACPFGIPAIHHTKGTMFKCNLCEGDPECVQECPRQALSFVEADEASHDKMRKAANRLMHIVERTQ